MIIKPNLIKISISFCFFAGILLLAVSNFSSNAQDRTIKKEINKSYLACYALEPTAKQNCTTKLAMKYIVETERHNENYLQNFQFESEKSGFKEFLNHQGLPCEAVNEGPVFIQEKQAYLVKCNPQLQYFMKFDYDIKQWLVVK